MLPIQQLFALIRHLWTVRKALKGHVWRRASLFSSSNAAIKTQSPLSAVSVLEIWFFFFPPIQPCHDFKTRHWNKGNSIPCSAWVHISSSPDAPRWTPCRRSASERSLLKVRDFLNDLLHHVQASSPAQRLICVQIYRNTERLLLQLGDPTSADHCCSADDEQEQDPEEQWEEPRAPRASGLRHATGDTDLLFICRKEKYRIILLVWRHATCPLSYII